MEQLNFKSLVSWMHRIKFGRSRSVSLYQLAEMYIIGIVKGTLTTRASSIAFSFFMAIFPFLIFVLNLIPFIPVENIEDTFSTFFLSLTPSEAQGFFHDVLLDIQTKPGRLALHNVFVVYFLYGKWCQCYFWRIQ